MRGWLSVITILIFSCSSHKGDTNTGICLNRLNESNIVEVKWSDFSRLAKMDGQWVKIEGYFAFSFEDIAIYSSKNPRRADALWISFKSEVEIQDDILRKLAGQKVVVYGKLNTNSGHRPLGFKASIDSAYCINPAE